MAAAVREMAENGGAGCVVPAKHFAVILCLSFPDSTGRLYSAIGSDVDTIQNLCQGILNIISRWVVLDLASGCLGRGCRGRGYRFQTSRRVPPAHAVRTSLFLGTLQPVADHCGTRAAVLPAGTGGVCGRSHPGAADARSGGWRLEPLLGGNIRMCRPAGVGEPLRVGMAMPILARSAPASFELPHLHAPPANAANAPAAHRQQLPSPCPPACVQGGHTPRPHLHFTGLVGGQAAEDPARLAHGHG